MTSSTLFDPVDPDRATFYDGGAQGYTNYPTLESA
jgi:hypothetical protein